MRQLSTNGGEPVSGIGGSLFVKLCLFSGSPEISFIMGFAERYLWFHWPQTVLHFSEEKVSHSIHIVVV
jgi:hypothetical protein